jgi:hypothetical protein
MKAQKPPPRPKKDQPTVIVYAVPLAPEIQETLDNDAIRVLAEILRELGVEP